jgi:TonB family protein
MLLRRLLGILLFASAAASVCAAEPPVDERVQAYRDFRTAFDVRNYSDALPLAVRVVDLTRNQFGKEGLQLVNPLTNVGTTYYRMRQYGPALDSYREALTLLDQQGDATNLKLIRPLHGMGMALRALDRDEEAIAPLKRAVDITRNREGLYSPNQLPMLRELIGSYMVARRVEDAGREQQYAFNVAETSYGKDDARLIRPLDEFARWNESTGRYTLARAMHLRAVTIADKAQPGSLLAIDGLRGIARSYLLAFVNGEQEENQQSDDVPASIGLSALTRAQSAPSSEGERALRVAAVRLMAASPADPQRLGAVQLDLADWYLTAGSKQRAQQALRDAWESLSQAHAQTLMSRPVPLVYRPPSSAVSHKTEDPDKFDQADVELRLTVNADGNVTNAVVVNPAPEREAAERAVTAAAKRSLFRPAVENGAPVVTTDYVHRERMYIRKPKAAT